LATEEIKVDAFCYVGVKYEKTDNAGLEEVVIKQMLQSKQLPLQTIQNQIPKGLPRQDRIIKATLLSMATPEYQLC